MGQIRETFRVGIKEQNGQTNGAQMKGNRPRNQAAARKRNDEATSNNQAERGASSPVTRTLMLVRGFLASISLSTSRLYVMAAVRAVTMAARTTKRLTGSIRPRLATR